MRGDKEAKFNFEGYCFWKSWLSSVALIAQTKVYVKMILSYFIGTLALIFLMEPDSNSLSESLSLMPVVEVYRDIMFLATFLLKIDFNTDDMEQHF